MGLIALEGMQFYAYHGVYKEEQLVGNEFTVDVYLQTAFDAASTSDDLADTINYETVYLICKKVMEVNTQLLETLAQRIIAGLKHQFNSIQQVQVKIRKANPFPGSRVQGASVELEDNFVTSCPRCGRGFICYRDDSCMNPDIPILPQTLMELRRRYKGCLCDNCLREFAG